MRRWIINLLLLAGICQAASTPSIVAHYSAVSQTASIPTTTVYTVPSTGTAMYRWNLYIETGICTATGTVTLEWTDDIGGTPAQNNIGMNCNGANGSNLGVTLPVRMVGGSTFTVSTSEPAGGPTYSVYIVLEKLP